jgi:type IV pilus assembly protein PilO
MSDRDRKILTAIVPIVVIVAYWFLLLAPKREEAATAADEVAKQEQRRDNARAALSQASTARTGFRGDYTQIVRLGKAIPARVDMPSLLVQLDSAAQGTGIRFTAITTGERSSASTAPPATAGSTPPAGTGTTPVQAGGQSAQSAPGTAAESANNAAATANQRSAAATQSGVAPGDTQTSTSAREGGLPVGGGAAAGGTAEQGAAPAGLETVSLDLEFVGDFFRLADFFHSVKRFVRVANADVVVNGRLITIDSVRYTSDPLLFPRLKAELTATVYLSPLAQGVTAGATPQGPPTTPASTGTTTPAGGSTAPANPAAPTAAATP